MARILWNQTGARQFQTGCDRGVLYLSDNTLVPWNGLTSVSEDFADIEIEECYLDGIKYLNRRSDGDYAGTLKAFTYPDEFMQFDGVVDADEGVSGNGQPVNDTFGLCYRTKIGNEVSGIDFAYKLHILYNLTAIPDSVSYETQNASLAPEEFSWKLNGIPIHISGLKPTVHVIIDSRRVRFGSMSFFEDYLYGNDTNDGQLPDVDTLLGLYQAAYPIT